MGTRPPLSNASQAFFFDNHPLFLAEMPVSAGRAHSPTVAVKVKRKIHYQAELTFCFSLVEDLLSTCVQACE